VRERAGWEQGAELCECDAAAGSAACECVGAVVMSVISAVKRYAFLCLALGGTTCFAQFPIPRDTNCVDRYGENAYASKVRDQPHPIQYGYQKPEPFFLKNDYEWEKWRPNAYLEKLSDLQVQPLPTDLVEAYLNGSAGVYAAIKMWKVDSQESQPFAIFGQDPFLNCRVVAQDALTIVSVGGTIIKLMHIGAGDEYPTADGRIQPVRLNEAMFHIGYGHPPLLNFSFPSRYLLLKRVQSTPCKLDKGSRPALIEGANQRCWLHRASAKVIESHVIYTDGKKTSYRELDLGEIYVREIHGQNSWDKRLFPKESNFVEKLLDQLIQFGRNR
jgi:hypothetical protein